MIACLYERILLDSYRVGFCFDSNLHANHVNKELELESGFHHNRNRSLIGSRNLVGCGRKPLDSNPGKIWLTQ
jgi:hypothetical protein